MNRVLIFLAISFLASCGGTKKHQKSPIDIMIRDMEDVATFEIMLYDMQDNSGLFSSEYLHQYTIVREKDSIVVNDSTEKAEVVKVPYKTRSPWYKVSKKFFDGNVNNMGMSLASRVNGGEVSKVPAPAGYNRYVGNRSYGYWGGGMWRFYGQYMFMSTMFHMMSPISYGGYNSYRNNYYGRRPYYGSSTNGRTQYGTRSSYGQKRMSNGTSRYGSGSSRRSSTSSSRSGRSSRSSGRGFGGK